ncbi:MAG TPA: triose-phosphate isomerase [Candidatus Saccharimonadales bacterium]|nr:triose-phosphate isomerase [Candidatus Saccharimonadales bacterium]
MNKRILIVGNWKMHLNTQQASLLVKRLDDRIDVHRDIEVVLAPSMLTLQPLSVQIDRRKFRLAAQNAFYKDEGAYTGEVSFTMLRGLVHYALVGHSERRIYFGETLEMVRDKVQAAVRNEISPILCIGENRQERAAGETKRVLYDQLTTALSNLTVEEVDKVVIAYEPVWAISTFGTGDPAKPDEIQQAVTWIRQLLADLYGKQLSEDMRVIYGASVDEEFVGGILGLKGVDGLLPGAASLNYHKFAGIVAAAHRHRAK